MAYKKALVLYDDFLANEVMDAIENCPPSSSSSMCGVRRGQNMEVHIPMGEGLSDLVIYPGCNPFELYKEFTSLNEGQRDAVKKVFCARDYVLLLGLPGTGKTSTLSLIVRALIARGERVMICSYTHSAVDNLLSKIADGGLCPPFAVRIGYETSVRATLRRYVRTYVQTRTGIVE
jgi:AAA domain